MAELGKKRYTDYDFPPRLCGAENKNSEGSARKIECPKRMSHQRVICLNEMVKNDDVRRNLKKIKDRKKQLGQLWQMLSRADQQADDNCH